MDLKHCGFLPSFLRAEREFVQGIGINGSAFYCCHGVILNLMDGILRAKNLSRKGNKCA